MALKFLAAHLTHDAMAKERFVREARAAAVLRHDAVCAIHDVQETDDGQVFIVMPYYEGRTLKEVLAEGPVPEARAFDIVAQVAAGLQAAHEKGMVHRDIKPANILLTPDDRVKILDFGLAKRDGDLDLTQSSSTVGTMAYMSPEQVQNHAVDARSDLWSLGVVFFELLTGARPFGGAYEAAVVYGIVNQDVALDGVPPRARGMVRKLLAKDPESRYLTANEVIEALSEARSTTAPAAAPAPAQGSGARSPGARVLMGVAAAVAIVLTLGWLATRGGDGAPDTPAVLASSGFPTVAVMYIENNTERQRFGNVIQDMLARNLGQVDSLQVISNQRMKDILRQEIGEGQEAIDAATATAVARQAGIQTMIIGSVVQFGAQYVFEVELTDVATGAIIDAVSVTAADESEVMAAVNELTMGILQGSGKLGGREGGLVRIQDVSTNNLTAYELFEVAEDHMNHWRFAQAQQSYEQAIERDSTFVGAYIGAAAASSVFGISPLADNSARIEFLERAARHVRHATPLERDQLAFLRNMSNSDLAEASAEAMRLADKYPSEKSLQFQAALIADDSAKVHYYDRLFDLDPGYALGYNMQAYDAVRRLEFDEAESSVRRYRALQPDVLNTMDSAWEVLTGSGRADKAVALLSDALAGGEDPANVYWRRMYSYAIQGDTLQAWADWQRYVDVLETKEPLASYRASHLALLFGQWERARVLSAAYLRETRRSSDDAALLRALRNHAAILHAVGRHGEAEALLDESVDISRTARFWGAFNPVPVVRAFDNVLGYALSGDTTAARRWLATLQEAASAPEADGRQRVMVEVATLAVSLNDLSVLRESMDGPMRRLTNMFPTLADAQSRLHALDGRVELARRSAVLVSHNVASRAFDLSPYSTFFIYSPLATYRLGLALEERGDRADTPSARNAALDAAEAAYRAALAQWTSTGATFRYVADARERLLNVETRRNAP
ncbi:MAG: serine/threonine-protein kinase [Rhodothermales bacterium]